MPEFFFFLFIGYNIPVKIQNPFLSVTASSHGGEISSIQLFSQEIVYQKTGSWEYSDHVLFPTIGIGSKYTCHEVPLTMEQHGFPRSRDFKETQISGTEMSFSLSSSPDTLRVYPYPFEIVETLRLEDDTLIRSHEVRNIGGEEMPFGIGDHVAFQVRYDKAKLTLPKTRFFPSNEVNSLQEEDLPIHGEVLLDINRHFLCGQGTIILKNTGEPLILDTGKGVTIEFIFNCPYIAIWTPRIISDDFLCIEPWWGLPYQEGDELELARRSCLNHLPAGERKIFTSRLRFRLS